MHYDNTEILRAAVTGLSSNLLLLAGAAYKGHLLTNTVEANGFI
jgi:hypothetical protein